MHDNIVLKAVLQQPDILQQIVSDPDNYFAPSPWIETQAFDNIQVQAFGRRVFADASKTRHAYYRKYTTPEERAALRLEITYLKYHVLKGWQLYEEIARVMSIKFKKSYSWREIKSMLDYTSEVIADIEQDSYAHAANVA